MRIHFLLPLLIAVALPALAATPRLTTTVVPLPALLDEAGQPWPVFSVALDPAARGLIVTSQQDTAYLAPWQGPLQQLDTLRDSAGQFSRPMQMRATGPGLLFIRRQPPRLELYDRNLQPKGDLPNRFYNPWPMELVGKQLFRIGTPVTPPLDSPQHWEDIGWRRQHGRSDCRVSVVDFTAAELREVPLVCNPVFDSPTGRILPSGDLAVSTDGTKVFAVTEARPYLSIIHIESSEADRLREISYLEDGETFPTFTKADEQLQFQSRSPDAPLTLRDRFDWFQGLLRWQDHIGLVFRRWDGERVHFLVDLFDNKGHKLANDLPLPLEPPTERLSHLAHLTMLNGPDGQASIFVRNRSARGEVTWQGLFRLTLDVQPQQADAPAGARLRFRLADLQTDQTIGKVRLTLRASGQHRWLDLTSSSDHFDVTVPPEISTRIELAASGYRSLSLEMTAARGQLTDLGTLFLDPGVAVQGTLLHQATGAPLAGATLSFLPPTTWGGLAARHFGWHHSVKTDSRGNFRLSGLEPGTQCLEVTHPQLAPSPVVVPDLDPGEQRDLGIMVLGTQTEVHGRVTDLHGQGQPNVEVELRTGSLHRPCVRLRQTTGEEGEADFPAVAAGRYLAVVRQHGTIQAVQAVTLEGSGRHQLDDLVLPLRRFQGTVQLDGILVQTGLLVLTSRSQAAYTPTPVFVQGSNHDRQQLLNDLQPTVVARVEADGSFDTEGTLPAGDILITFTTAEGVEMRQILPLPTGSRLDVDFAGGSALHGIAQTSEGDPLPGAVISLRSSLPDLRGIDLRTTRAGADGTFVLPNIPTGDYNLIGTWGSRERPLTVEVPARFGAEAEETVELTFSPQLPRVLAAHILTPAREPATGAAVLASDGRHIHVIQTTDAGGLAQFQGLEPGTYHLLTADAGGLYEGPTVQLLTAGTTTVEISLPEAKSVDFRITNQDAIGQRVALKTPNGWSAQPLLGFLGLTPRVGWSGEVELPRLSSGTWDIELFETAD